MGFTWAIGDSMELVYSDRNLYSSAFSCAFNRPEHHRQAVDIVGTPCFGGNSIGDIPQKLVHHAKVPSCLLGVRLFGRDKTLALIKESFRFLDIFSSNIVEAVPANRAFGSANPPDTIPRRTQAFSAPTSTKCATDAVGHLENCMRRSAMLPPRPFRIPFLAIDRLRICAS